MLIDLALFLSAFLSATVLPGSSEAVLLAALGQGSRSTAWLIAIATLGNTLGATTSWAVAAYIPQHFSKHSNPEKLNQWRALFRRYGTWSLLFSWVPIIGDALPIAAGLAGTPWYIFAPLVMVGKAIRYLAIAGLFQLF